MVAVQYYSIFVGHLTVELHPRLNAAQLLHTAHIFALDYHHGSGFPARRTRLYVEHRALYLRQLRIEHLRNVAASLAVCLFRLIVLFLDETVYGIAVNTREAALLKLLLVKIYHSRVELAVEQKHTVTFCLGIFYICILRLLVVCVEIYRHVVLVGLVVFYQCAVFVKSVILAVNILEKGKIFCAVVEIGLRKHSVVYEYLQIVPFALKILTVVLENALQAVGNFLGDVSGDFLDVRIRLQVAAAHIQRNVGRVYHAVKQRKEVRHNVLHVVGYEHLIAVKLYLVALQVKVVLYFREIQNARKIERIIHIKVNPE